MAPSLTAALPALFLLLILLNASTNAAVSSAVPGYNASNTTFLPGTTFNSLDITFLAPSEELASRTSTISEGLTSVVNATATQQLANTTITGQTTSSSGGVQ